ncbi:protein GLUTAMINE DUMPER 6-like [Lolium perenne]|uniref:protein GLUTAMINE DUMPER 6-like n=1 Tax=Lolium perenne TaxID=4522 RepID=UPI0021F62BB4|nr:protein GLUTAMINE DUMPER 6-like [Lolium perenne]
MRPVREAAAALVGIDGGDDQAAAASAAGHVAHAHAGLWRTPTPYIFLGFALMMGLIAVALFMLVCTRRKPSTGVGASRRGSCATEEASASARGATISPLDREPKIVVIMAGDDMPSFIASARPLSFSGEPSKPDAA